MRIAEDKHFLSALAGIFVLTVASDLVLTTTGLPTQQRNLIVWVLTTTTLFLLLLARSRYLNRSALWATSALVPPIGFLAGLLLFWLNESGSPES